MRYKSAAGGRQGQLFRRGTVRRLIIIIILILFLIPEWPEGLRSRLRSRLGINSAGHVECWGFVWRNYLAAAIRSAQFGEELGDGGADPGGPLVDGGFEAASGALGCG